MRPVKRSPTDVIPGSSSPNGHLFKRGHRLTTVIPACPSPGDQPGQQSLHRNVGDSTPSVLEFLPVIDRVSSSRDRPESEAPMGSNHTRPTASARSAPARSRTVGRMKGLPQPQSTLPLSISHDPPLDRCGRIAGTIPDACKPLPDTFGSAQNDLGVRCQWRIGPALGRRRFGRHDGTVKLDERSGSTRRAP